MARRVAYYIKFRENCSGTFGDRNPSNLHQMKINGQTIKRQKSVRYLEVRIDRKFTQHINETITRAISKRASLFPMISHQRKLPTKKKILIMQMYISSILTYASPKWGEHSYQQQIGTVHSDPQQVHIGT